MQRWAKRLFVPLTLLLVLVAVYLVWFDGDHRPKSIRDSVPIERFALSNGLTVVVMPNSRLPVVSHMLLVKAGAADDPYGKTGLAHYLEHLMFTGSKNYPEGVYDRTISRFGGEQNAYTTKDYTLYYATIAKEHLAEVMAMEADRLQHPAWDAVKIGRELKVITEERNQRIDTRPATQLVEQLTALTFLNHPYHHPTIGWAEDIAALTGDDARGFFANYYRASNMVLVLAGDITQAEARRLAQRYYGGLAAGAAVAREWPKEPPLRLTRRAEMEDASVHEPRLVRMYSAPSLGEPNRAQALPLAVFAQLVGGGESSPLYQQLVREQRVASMVQMSYDAYAIGPESFTVVAVPAPGVSLPQLEAALDRALDAMVAAPADEAALLRAKTQLKASVVFAQDGLSSLAQWIAALYALGLDEQYFYEWPAAIDRVTAEEIRTAAQATLAPKRRVTGYLVVAAPPAGTGPEREATDE